MNCLTIIIIIIIINLKKENKLHDDVGSCQTSIDKTLKELGVDRQAYFGGSIIGNHCDKILKDDDIDILKMGICLKN